MWPYSPIAPTSLHLQRKRCTDVYQQANCVCKPNCQVRMSGSLTTFTENPKGCCGSTTAINHPVRVGSGTGHKAVIHQVQIAVSLIAVVGQLRLLEDMKTPPKGGAFRRSVHRRVVDSAHTSIWNTDRTDGTPGAHPVPRSRPETDLVRPASRIRTCRSPRVLQIRCRYEARGPQVFKIN
jgi:hypothetical protein